MAAVGETAGTRRDIRTGHQRIVIAALTSVADTNTWDPGLAIIEHFDFKPNTAAAGTQWGATLTAAPANRQARVTFAVESGTLAGTASAIGQ